MCFSGENAWSFVNYYLSLRPIYKNLYIMPRISYIDIAKGILISLLVLHHLIWTSVTFVKVPNDFLNTLYDLQMPLFVGYFMQTFFVISGFCSNFSIPWKEFLWKQVKTLLVPNIAFTFLVHLYHGDFSGSLYDIVERGGWLWFVTALFICKIVYYFVRRWISNEYIIFGLFLVTSLVGVCLNDHDLFFNYWWHRQALTLLLFLALGNWLRRYMHDKRIWIFAVVYLVGVAACYLLHIDVPYITAGFNATKYTWGLHVLIAVGGSVAFLKLCSYLRNSPVIEYIGQNTLVIYMLHLDVLYPLIENFLDIYNKNTTEGSLLATFAIWTATMVLCLLMGKIFGTRYLRFMIGR